MATEDILIWDGTEYVSLSGNSGLSPEVDPTVDVTPIADCEGTPTAVATPTYYDSNNDVTADPTKAARTKIKFGFGLVPGCDGTDGTSTEVKATGPHTATPLDKDANPTVTITPSEPVDGVLDMTFAFGIPAGKDGKDGESIEIIGTIDSEGGDSGQGLIDLNTGYPDAVVGDVVVDVNGEGWLSDGSSGWTSIGQFRGDDGKQALFNQPTVSTVDCSDGVVGEATASITLNAGDSTDDSNVYDVSFGIPAGCSGSDGEDGLNAQVVKQASEPSVDSEGEPVRMGCIWIKTDA